MQLKHGDIWRAIDRLAEKHGLSASGLAKKAGLSSTVFNPSKRALGNRKRWPSTESIAFILKATDTSLDEFVAMATSESGNVTGRMLPVSGTGAAQKETAFDEDGYPSGRGWDDIRFPGFNDPHAFALEIEGKHFEPMYRAGDRIIVSPAEKPRRDDRVLVRMRTGKIVIGELGRESARTIELTAPGASSITTLPARDIARVYRILWASQ